MKLIFLYISLLLFSACHTSRNAMSLNAWNGGKDSSIVVTPPRDAIGEFSPITLIISYDAQVGKQPLLDAIKACGAQVIYDYKMMSGMAFVIIGGLIASTILCLLMMPTYYLILSGKKKNQKNNQ